MSQGFDIPENLGKPYEDHFEDLIDYLSDFETRGKPEEVSEVDRIELDYGWQAILYEKSESFFGSVRSELKKNLLNSDTYRTTADYEWELRTPDGETYRRLGIDIYPQEFESMVQDFLN